MADQLNSVGDFYSAMEQTEILEGTIWLAEWKEAIPAEQLQNFMQAPLTDERVRNFTAAMVQLFRRRMQSIYTDDLHNSTMQRGKEFLEHVRAVAERFGVDVSDIVKEPITPTEAVFLAQ